jgi:MOSC domain-containing protein YiiM
VEVVSVNVGMPRLVTWRGDVIKTGIFKQAVPGVRPLRRFNLEGDRQADLSVHGGKDKAVYAYASEHYDYWRTKWPRPDYPWGIFGENLSTSGLLEEDVCIGDEFQIGTARLVVTQPRMPCLKLGIRFGDCEIIKRFLESRRPGIYFGIVDEGALGPGDRIEQVRSDPHRLNLVEVLELILDTSAPKSKLERALAVPALADDWKKDFTNRLTDQ